MFYPIRMLFYDFFQLSDDRIWNILYDAWSLFHILLRLCTFLQSRNRISFIICDAHQKITSVNFRVSDFHQKSIPTFRQFSLYDICIKVIICLIRIPDDFSIIQKDFHGTGSTDANIYFCIAWRPNESIRIINGLSIRKICLKIQPIIRFNIWWYKP